MTREPHNPAKVIGGLERALAEERSARLKAEARIAELALALDRQRKATHEESRRAWLTEREADEALALLSKAREALRVADENLCGGCEPELADLAKILGTGETT